MNIKDWLKKAEAQLANDGIPTARLDCLILLEDVLNTNRTQLLAHPEHEITEAQQRKLDLMITKRSQHIPLAFIRRKTEFYGREFYVDERVLEPRPESETMIDMLLQLRLSPAPTIADVGTGSGALGITTSLELLTAQVDLLEIDAAALAVAKKNVQLHDSRARCVYSDLLAATTEHYDVLLCNLPYVPEDFQINRAATHEPTLAIFGGTDGLDIYRRLFDQIQTRAHRPQHILTESLPPQHDQLAKLASDNGYTLTLTNDFIQYFFKRSN